MQTDRVTSNLRFLLVSGASSSRASWANTLHLTPARSITPPHGSPAHPQPVSQGRLGSSGPVGQDGFVLPRGLRSKQVITQTVLPIAACCFVTMVWALVDTYTRRNAVILILQ